VSNTSDMLHSKSVEKVDILPYLKSILIDKKDWELFEKRCKANNQDMTAYFTTVLIPEIKTALYHDHRLIGS